VTSNKKTKLTSPKVKLAPLAKRAASKSAESTSKSAPKRSAKSVKKPIMEQLGVISPANFDWYSSAKDRLSVAQKRATAGHFSAERFSRILDE